MNDPEVVVGMKLVRIGSRKMSNNFLFYDVYEVIKVDANYGEVLVQSPAVGAIRSRFNDFWSRWEIYKNPNDALKGLI